ncbi:MAG: monovalent cation/H+ antiporter subunit D family protein [Hyphomicrobiaceae bacterium]|nr:monovalent cation/H+ antiporter subunit D family protein [Hyphomicrobiaceae bacterium]
MTGETLIILALLVPTVGAALIWATAWNPNFRETTTLVTAGILFIIVLTILGRFLSGEPLATGTVPIAPGLELGFSIEPLGMLFACIASGLWIVNSIYSIGYMRGNNEPRQTPFYMCFAIALASTMGIAFAANLFTLFLFYEILTLSTYPLVTHKGDDSAREGGRTYLLVLLGTSTVLLLPAIIATAVIAGTLNFEPGGILAGKVSPTVLSILLAMFMFGIGKAALMPFHKWLPAAMVAPTPVSALLHAVAVVKAGVFSVVKVIVYVFGVETLAGAATAGWLLYIAGATILIASVVALKADNLKRRLAYSTVSQLSYVILAAAILAPISIVGASMHIAAHAISKITLFFAAGSIYTAAHLTEVSQLNGIGRKMPWTMGAFAIGALSMIGVPPTAGFVSKWYILLGAMDAQQWIAVGVIIVSTLLNAAYFLPIVYAAFFRAPDKKSPDHGEAPLPIVVALTVTAAGTVILFLFPGVPLALSKMLGLVGGG